MIVVRFQFDGNTTTEVSLSRSSGDVTRVLCSYALVFFNSIGLTMFIGVSAGAGMGSDDIYLHDVGGDGPMHV